MDLFLSVLGGLAGVVAGIVVGLWLGGRLRNRATAWYWVANVAVVLLGVAGDVAGLSIGQWWLVIASLAFIGGGLTGLKYGYGKSVGVWRVHDRVMGSDDLPQG